MHINVLELKAILFGLRSLCDHVCDSHNFCVEILQQPFALTIQEALLGLLTKTKLQNQFVSELLKGGYRLSSAHIPGRLNMETDEESRTTELKAEWKLNRRIFHSTLEYYRNRFICILAKCSVAKVLFAQTRSLRKSNKCFLTIMGRQKILFPTLCMRRQDITKNFSR